MKMPEAVKKTSANAIPLAPAAMRGFARPSGRFLGGYQYAAQAATSGPGARDSIVVGGANTRLVLTNAQRNQHMALISK